MRRESCSIFACLLLRLLVVEERREERYKRGGVDVVNILSDFCACLAAKLFEVFARPSWTHGAHVAGI